MRDDPEINFIPLIDVLLVILIFLMVTTTYQRVAELQITLPEADADAAEAAAEGDQRRHRRAGPLRRSTRPCSRSRPSAALADALKRAAGDAKDPVVIINADANATHQSVIHVMEAARAGRARPHHVRDADRPPSERVGPAAAADRRSDAAVERMTLADRLVAAWYAPRLTALPRRCCCRCRSLFRRGRRAAARALPPRRAADRARCRCRSSSSATSPSAAAGKTPLAIALAEALARARLAPGHRQPRLRRRARRAARGRASTTIPRAVGDEPLLLARAGLPGVDRRATARRPARALLAAHPDVRRDRLPTTACSTTRSRATSRSRSSTRRAASATAGCCRRARCASRRRGSTTSTRSCVLVAERGRGARRRRPRDVRDERSTAMRFGAASTIRARPRRRRRFARRGVHARRRHRPSRSASSRSSRALGIARDAASRFPIITASSPADLAFAGAQRDPDDARRTR